MLELIVLGQIPGTGIQISFTELLGIFVLIGSFGTYAFMKIKKMMIEYQQKQEDISKKTI